MKYIAGLLLLMLFGMMIDRGLEYVLKVFIYCLPAIAAGLASVFFLQWALGRWYRLNSSALKTSRLLVGACVLVSMVSGGGVAVLTLYIVGSDGYGEPAPGYVVTGAVFIMAGSWISGRFRKGLQASSQNRARTKSRVERKKSAIIGMIDQALSGDARHGAGGLVLATDSAAAANLSSVETESDGWRDMRYQEMPSWVRLRIEELDNSHLAGRKFEYRRAPDGEYQRRVL